MGTNGAAHRGNGQELRHPLPQLTAVGNVLLQKLIGKAAVGQGKGLLEVDAPALLHQLAQEVVALLGATGLALHGH